MGSIEWYSFKHLLGSCSDEFVSNGEQMGLAVMQAELTFWEFCGVCFRRHLVEKRNVFFVDL
jgi:hypothetical protein